MRALANLLVSTAGLLFASNVAADPYRLINSTGVQNKEYSFRILMMDDREGGKYLCPSQNTKGVLDRGTVQLEVSSDCIKKIPLEAWKSVHIRIELLNDNMDVAWSATERFLPVSVVGEVVGNNVIKRTVNLEEKLAGLAAELGEVKARVGGVESHQEKQDKEIADLKARADKKDKDDAQSKKEYAKNEERHNRTDALVQEAVDKSKESLQAPPSK